MRLLPALLLSSLAAAGCESASVATGSDSAGGSAGTRTAVDLIVAGEHVLTMDEPGLIANGAVAIAGGEIVAVGTAQEIGRRYRARENIGGAGRVVMPGLVNGHTHAAMSLLRGVADDLALKEWLEEYIFPAEVRLVDSEFVSIGTELACWEMIRGGTTTFVDMYYFPEAVAMAAIKCGLRAVVAPTVIDQKSPDADDGAASLAVATAFVDQWKGRHDRITPCIGAHAVYTLSPEWLIKVRDAARRSGSPVCMHLSESRFEVEFARSHFDSTSTELLESLSLFDNHVIGAHVVWPSDSDIATLARRGVGVIHNPTSNMKIASGIAPVPEMLARGVRVGLGTDGPASNNDLDMWEEIRLAAFLHKLDKMDPTVLPALTVLEMATWRGAEAIGLGDQVGRLRPGLRADLIQVSFEDLSFFPTYNVLSHLVYVADEHDVVTTIVDGQVIMRDRQVLTIDAAALRRAANALDLYGPDR